MNNSGDKCEVQSTPVFSQKQITVLLSFSLPKSLGYLISLSHNIDKYNKREIRYFIDMLLVSSSKRDSDN